MSVTILRIIGILEGISSFLLFFIAMPMKYLMDNDSLIRITGMGHGVLFILFVVALLVVCQIKKWSLNIFLLGLVAAIIPCATFIFELKLKKLA